MSSNEPKSAIARYAYGYSDDRAAAVRELVIVICMAIYVIWEIGK
jgi:hypothetical protein